MHNHRSCLSSIATSKAWSCSQRGNTSALWLTQLSVSQRFIFWLLGLCCFALLEQWFVWENLGFSLHFLLAHVSVIPWWHKEQNWTGALQIWLLYWETAVDDSYRYSDKIWVMQNYDKSGQWKVLNGTSWQLGEIFWKPMVQAVVSLCFAQKAMSSPN